MEGKWQLLLFLPSNVALIKILVVLNGVDQSVELTGEEEVKGTPTHKVISCKVSRPLVINVRPVGYLAIVVINGM